MPTGPTGEDPIGISATAIAEAQCDQRFMKMTVGNIPNSASLAQQSGLPLGVILRPLAPDENGEDNIDVVNFGSCGIVRCKRCRTYVNPFVQWLDNGRRWRCNLCGASNDVPSSYFCHLDANGQRRDKDQRPELCTGSVELVAPAEYMVRPPQAPVYMFVIDVSASAVQSGMLQTVVEAIKDCLDTLPGSPRTQVGVLTYDSTIHFYNLKSTLNQPQMMVVSPLQELFLPIPDDLLVNLSESREVVETLLDSLPTMFENTPNVETCFGPALQAAFKVMAHIGGKMCIFQGSLPSLGEGRLKHRENPRLLGTEKEHTLFHAEEPFYKTKAVEFSKYHVCCELFLTAAQYTDVAALAQLSKHTGGQLYYYPAFNGQIHGGKLKGELTHALTRTTGFEAVMRVRCTRGMRISNFYGNFFIRGTDLLALPNCHADSTFGVELAYADTVVSASVISVQAALLYTTSSGERRIRVHTIAAPVTTVFGNLFLSADVDAVCNMQAKIALETSLKTGLDSARDLLYRRLVDVMRSYRSTMGQGGLGYGQQQQQQQQGGLGLPEQLQLLPLYTMALQKNKTFRGGTEISTDERGYMMQQLACMPVEDSRVFIYPRLFALHDMDPTCGTPCEDTEDESIVTAGTDKIKLPAVVNLSCERLVSEGCFLLEDSQVLYMWLGHQVSPAFLQSVFSIQSLEGIDCSQLVLLQNPDELSNRVNGIVNALREERAAHMQLCVVREGDPNEGRFFWHLVEDRASFTGGTYSYPEFLNHVTRQSQGMGR